MYVERRVTVWTLAATLLLHNIVALPFCPTDFLEIKTSTGRYCYAIISETMTWGECYHACIAGNSKAHLATVYHAAQNEVLRLPFESVSDAERKACTDGANYTWYWTAGQTANSYTHDTPTFYWKYVNENGHVEYSTPVIYANWWSFGQPNTDASFTSILIGGAPNGPASSYLKWGTNPTSATRCCLCEIDMRMN